MISRKRMVKNFTDMVKIDSLSGKEKKAALFIREKLRKLGAKTVSFDSAAKKVGGESGNLIARFTGDAGRAPFLLSAHMDTVVPGNGIRPIVRKDRIVSDGRTILGADCKSGIAVILEILSVIKERKLPHPPLEIAFSVCEEIGLLGAKHMDYSRISARRGLVFDNEKPLNEVAVKSPAADKVEIEIYGKAAHAGVCPEKGLSAIKMASYAIAKMKLGRIDSETTANIGIIEGGEATNIITPKVRMVGEVRSHKTAKLDRQAKHMRECLRESVRKFGNGSRGGYMFRKNRSFPGLSINPRDPVLEALRKAMSSRGMKLKPAVSGGGTDANIFCGRGIKTPILATGMREVHTTNEYLLLGEFFKSAEIALETVINIEND